MNPHTRLMAQIALVSSALYFAPASRADITGLLAANNATVQPAGPRSGANGKKFFNIEGNNNGGSATNSAFASFGVADFTVPAGTTFTQAQSLTLTLTQSNSNFTASGALNFYLADDTATSIESTNTALKYDATNLPDGIGTQLGTKYLLGSGAFTKVATGNVDTFTFVLSGVTQNYLTNEINANSPIRVIVAPGDTTVAATYAGYTNTTATTPGPKITITDAVTATTPAPSSLLVALVGVPGIGLLVRRRKVAK